MYITVEQVHDGQKLLGGKAPFSGVGIATVFNPESALKLLVGLIAIAITWYIALGPHWRPAPPVRPRTGTGAAPPPVQPLQTTPPPIGGNQPPAGGTPPPGGTAPPTI